MHLEITLNPKKHLHFIGIGGIGMSALALIFKKRGYSVSGSDKVINPSIQNLEKIGVTIFNQQTSSNLNNIQAKEIVIIISSAIPTNNEELQSAYKKNLNILHRSDLLAFLVKQQKSILIAGSHGKTTTSTLITTLMAKNNQDPTAIIGGIIPYFKSNAHSGKGEFIIAEIDESDGSIIKYHGKIGLITNIELDHTDYYKDIKSLMKKINIFAENCDFTIANYDCNNLKEYLSKGPIWWSTKESEKVQFAGIPIHMDGSKTIAKYYENGSFIDEITIPVPGFHNLNNTIGAIAAIRSTGTKFVEIKRNLQYIRSPKRRFEFKGVWEDRQIIDDYAHHPSEIRETISMARLMIKSKQSLLPNPCNRLIGVFQPHRYSRTRDLMNDFAESLGKVDLLFLAEIYSAGEKPIKGINIEKLKSYIFKYYPSLPIFTSSNLKELEYLLTEKTIKGDLILIMGAGDITKLSESLKNRVSKIEKQIKTHAA